MYLSSGDRGFSGVCGWTGASTSDASIVRSKSCRLGTGSDNVKSFFVDPLFRYHQTPFQIVTGDAPL